MEFNKYNKYSYSYNKNTNALDSVDELKQDLLRMTEYDDVKNFITHKFGEFEGEKWVQYPELGKQVYLCLNSEKIEFCALKDKKQYFGRGWKLKEVDKQ